MRPQTLDFGSEDVFLIQPPNPQIQIPSKREPHQIRNINISRSLVNPPKPQNHRQHQHPQKHQPEK